MPTESILVEILKEAERVLNEASPESSRGSSDGSPPEVLEAVEEGTRKALWLARRLAERSQSAST